MTETKQPENDDTAMDAALMNMIEPKVREIQQKFNKGTGLTQDDVQTLLLKAQYNHINHLDLKLSEVTTSVAELKNEFKITELKFESLKSDINIKLELLEEKISRTIQQALNKNMMLLITVIGAFLILSKLIDRI